MIISRTPFRISFVGGGTDLQSFYNEEGGAVISTAINKYVYITVKKQNDLHPHRIRISYSTTENVEKVTDIKHPIVREVLGYLGVNHPIEITSIADIPARTGLGSSSTFTVGLLNAIHALNGEHVSSKKLAEEACYIEIEKLGRPIGKQDQYAAAFGGMNSMIFNPDESVSVSPIICKEEIRKKLFGNLLSFYTGITRDTNEILREQINNKNTNHNSLRELKKMVTDFKNTIENGQNIDHLGEILHQSWMKKRQLTQNITNTKIDGYYENARKAGAIGGKLLGAGGGGFLLIYADKHKHAAIRESLKDLIELNFDYESEGSKIIYIA
ncbi:MAG: GHMP kinase [Candidatus Micrarchaeota archaeon]|nr:GHMP kinase [Candidatus Micrarchaeota archaeon]